MFIFSYSCMSLNFPLFYVFKLIFCLTLDALFSRNVINQQVIRKILPDKLTAGIFSSTFALVQTEAPIFVPTCGVTIIQTVLP